MHRQLILFTVVVFGLLHNVRKIPNIGEKNSWYPDCYKSFQQMIKKYCKMFFFNKNMIALHPC